MEISVSHRSISSEAAASSHLTSVSNWLHPRQHSFGADFDYRNPELISDWIKCAICLGPFSDPVTSVKCSHTFCRSCIVQHAVVSQPQGSDTASTSASSSSLSTSSRDPTISCPSCRLLTRLSSFKSSASLIRNLVDSLVITCPLQERGCSWSGERCAMQGHLRKDCGYIWVGEVEELDTNNDQSPDPEESETLHAYRWSTSISNKPDKRRRRPRCECGQAVYRKDWASHQAEGCTVQWEQCAWCMTMVRGGQLKDESAQHPHHLECAACPLECTLCRETVNRGNMQEHLAANCPEVNVHCPMAPFGCVWVGARAGLGSDHATDSGEEIRASKPSATADVDRLLQDARPDQSHLSQCALWPLKSYLQATHARLEAVESENASLRQELQLQSQALRSSNGQLLQCIQVLGKWAVTTSDDVPSPGIAHEATRAPQSSETHETATDDFSLRWPELPASLDRTSQVAALGLTALERLRDASTGPSALESTLASLSESTAGLDRQQGELARAICESRREGVLTSLEVGRLAEELANLRMGLHNVARHAQMRGAIPGPTSGSHAGEVRSVGGHNAASNADVGAENGMSAPDTPGPAKPARGTRGAQVDETEPSGGHLPLYTSRNAGSSHYLSHLPPPAAYHHHHYHHPAAVSSLFAGGPSISSSGLHASQHHLYGSPLIPPPLPHQFLHPQHSPLPSGPALPALRRFWSGLEQTKL
ncbi:unnamed protein product [Parajaminaea phylloscopi]